MPQGEIETHPYLEMGQIAGSKALILGSFPVYECTDNDNGLKRQLRARDGTIRFFYGSNANSLWHKYAAYVDDKITHPWQIDAIMSSLRQSRIAVSDLILACERYISKTHEKTREIKVDEYSSDDGALRRRQWNRDAIRELIAGGVERILCTSKGVLYDLEKEVICPYGDSIGHVDGVVSQVFQAEIIGALGGDDRLIINPIARVFNIGGRTLSCMAIPSPGSPQRRLKDFGFCTEDWRSYADGYFSNAFRWLVSGDDQ